MERDLPKPQSTYLHIPSFQFYAAAFEFTDGQFVYKNVEEMKYTFMLFRH